MNVLSDVTPLLIVLVGSLSVIDGSLTLGAALAFFAYVDRMRSPVTALVQAFPALTEGSVAIGRVFDFLQTPVTIQEKEQTCEPQEFRQSIEFRDVTFGYSDGEPVLKGISFILEKGKTYAFVGESGGGKSTIMHRYPDVRCERR